MFINSHGSALIAGKIFSCRHVIFLPVFILASHAISPALQALDNQYRIEISKTDQELRVKKDNQLVAKFRIAYGKGANGNKRQLGDNKTPTGHYKVLQFKSNSRFHFFMQIDYPNLLDAWYGYKNQIITAREFKEIAIAYKSKRMPPQDTALGGYIGIHGLGEVSVQKLDIHDKFNWTEGCIALKNEEITELRKYVSIGTPITIKD
ncbi:MAG: L,D-transpeptidase [Proteobacteria bacterium]|nr:L,D-transpeptidase [Pseudomonadota bacterium]